DRDEQHSDAHSGPERNGVAGIRLSAKARECGARVREGVDPDSKPRDAVAAGDAEEAERQDDDDLRGLKAYQDLEVQKNHEADEQLEQQDEFSLRDEVCLA